MNLGGAVHLNKTGLCIFLVSVFVLFIYMLPRNPADTKSDKSVNLKVLLSLSIEAARNGAAQVISTKDDLEIMSKGKTREGANESVTTADIKSHFAMLGTLRRAFPDLNVVSEEGKAEGASEFVAGDVNIPDDVGDTDNVFVDLGEVTVWIDPLDATQEYTEKLYQYVTTMVCVAVKGKPVIGVIHDVFNKTTYWGWVGNGKSANLIKPSVKHNGTVFIVSRSHSGKIRVVLEKITEKYTVVEAGGAGYKVLQLMKGEADAYVHITAIKKWDVCAGNAILNALGGRMTTKDDKEIDYGDTKTVENRDGLIATLENHDLYVNKL